MTGAVDSDPDALRRIGFALRKLDTDADIAASRAVSVAERNIGDVQEENRRREHALDQARRGAQVAEAELARCMSSRERSCAAESDRLLQAKRRVHQCEDQLAISKRAVATATRVESDVRNAARRLGSRMNAALEDAQRFLFDRALALDEYLSGSSGAAGSVGMAPNGAMVPGGLSSAAGSPGTSSSSNTVSGLVELGSTGVFEVPLHLIDDSDGSVSGNESFEKVSLADTRRAIEVLHREILPCVKGGWDPHGSENGELSDEARTIADYFFGDTRVKLRRETDGSLSVVNGYHRIYAARELGVDSLPADVR